MAGLVERAGLRVAEATSGAEATARLAREEFDVVLVDVRLPDASGLDLLRWARAAEVDSEMIVLTGHADVETAVEAMRSGAYDFLAKPWKNAELLEVVAKAAEKKALRRENSALREVLTRRDGLPTIVGESAPLRVPRYSPSLPGRTMRHSLAEAPLCPRLNSSSAPTPTPRSP